MTSPEPLRAAIYARVSTFDQQPENQLAELRRYVQARHWSAQEYVDQGGVLRSMWIRASAGPRTDALPWISWSAMPNAGSSMS